MTWQNSAITITTLLPIVGALGVLLVPRGDDRLIKGIGIAITGVCLALAIAIAATYDYSATCATPPCLQFVLNVQWIPVIGARYHVGIDGISMPLYVLTFLLGFLCAVYTGRYVPEPGRIKAFLALTLLLITGMAGTFVAFDLILFFVFWELVLVPMYFLIGVWGSANRQYAAIKFFLYTLLGSVFMLLGFIAMYFKSSPHTFDIIALQHQAATSPFARNAQLLIFAAVFLGFAVKVPVWPFHTWLPDAHTEAPTVGSMLLAGVLLKLGAYGFLRLVVPLFPEQAQSFAPILAALAVAGIILGALAAWGQNDFKRLVAYSSVNHMGFAVLGIAAFAAVYNTFVTKSTGNNMEMVRSVTMATNGAVMQMFTHGLSSAGMFLLVGALYHKAHTRDLTQFGGLWTLAPVYGALLIFTSMASLGL